jgi:hypothetical protein
MPHFTVKDTKAQKRKVTCLGSHSTALSGQLRCSFCAFFLPDLAPPPGVPQVSASSTPRLRFLVNSDLGRGTDS